MPRRPRFALGGYAFHVLNRAVGRGVLFEKEADYLAFETAIQHAHQRIPLRLLSYTLMPNHWHLVLWPRKDDQLSEFMRLLTVTHTQRWHAHHHSAGTGPLYQGRFKSFPIQEDQHLTNVCRYVERNALRANLVSRAQDWQWSSLAHRRKMGHDTPWLLPAADWPVPLPSDWLRIVNRPQHEHELDGLRQSVRRGRPYGSDLWCHRTAKVLGLQSTLRPRGRPRRRKPI